ncbi:MAG: DUF2267 domain-containing protein [Chloroflexi bacterium SZAS-1]|jgi:hypothetical protein|nr:DUF2267 domain-containing protein [Chloroflexi bacterium SZAS-1]HNP87316.1 DUF2267 domain-containing protein [Kouleothrix sp.]
MDELVKIISERTGLPADQARAAALAAVDFLKSKLPEAMQGYVDMALNSGGAGGGDIASQATNVLGGLFGGNK